MLTRHCRKLPLGSLTTVLLGTAVGAMALPAQALSVYHVGNSLVLQNEQRGVIKALAIQAGHQHSYSMSVILGAPLAYIWSNPGSSGGWEGQPYPAGLAPSRAWDALILEPYDREFRFYPYDNPSAEGYGENDVIASNNFYNLALAGNPRAQLFIYEIFPTKSGWTAIPEQRTLPHALTVAEQVNKLHPTAPPVLVIPAGDVIQKLGALADQGQLPHIASHAGLYGDEDHLNEVGTYAVALTHLACLYREDPHVYANRPVYPPGSDFPTGDAIWKDTTLYQLLGPVGGEVWPETAAIIKNVVAEVIANTPRSGVELGVRIATAALPAGLIGQPYASKLVAELGVAPYTWSVTGGTLPPGLRLVGDTVSGTPTTAGTTSFTVQLVDSSIPPRSVTRTFTMAVAPGDVALTIDASPLPAATRGTRFAQTLNAAGGVAPFTWRVESGRLPLGLSLGGDGSLQGSPGEEGTFTFAAAVTDSSVPPRIARRTFTLVVGPLGAATVVASPRAAQACGGSVNGASASGAAARPIGTTDNQVRFGAAWDAQNLYVSIQVRDARVVTTTGPLASTGDAVEVFVNSDNAKSILYGARDRRVVIGPRGDTWLPDGRSTGIAATSSVTSDGYAVELSIPWTNLGTTPAANMTLGFDVANHDDDGAGRAGSLYWFGGPDDVNFPAAWGNLILVAAATSTSQGDAGVCDAGFTPVADASARADAATVTTPPAANADGGGVVARDAGSTLSTGRDGGSLPGRDGGGLPANDDGGARSPSVGAVDGGRVVVNDSAAIGSSSDAGVAVGDAGGAVSSPGGSEVRGGGCAVSDPGSGPKPSVAALLIAGAALLRRRARGTSPAKAHTPSLRTQKIV